MEGRFRIAISDLLASDPGLTLELIGPAFERGLGGHFVSRFPLRLLVPVTDDAVEATVLFCCNEIARVVAAGWQPA